MARALFGALLVCLWARSMPAQDPPFAVEIVDRSSDAVGGRLVYNVKELVRRSAAFRLTTDSERRLQVVFITMPRFDHSPDTATMYAVIWNFVAQDERGLWVVFYDKSTIGYAGTDVVQVEAETIVSRTDAVVDELKHAIGR